MNEILFWVLLDSHRFCFCNWLLLVVMGIRWLIFTVHYLINLTIQIIVFLILITFVLLLVFLVRRYCFLMQTLFCDVLFHIIYFLVLVLPLICKVIVTIIDIVLWIIAYLSFSCLSYEILLFDWLYFYIANGNTRLVILIELVRPVRVGILLRGYVSLSLLLLNWFTLAFISYSLILLGLLNRLLVNLHLFSLNWWRRSFVKEVSRDLFRLSWFRGL